MDNGLKKVKDGSKHKVGFPCRGRNIIRKEQKLNCLVNSGLSHLPALQGARECCKKVS